MSPEDSGQAPGSPQAGMPGSAPGGLGKGAQLALGATAIALILGWFGYQQIAASANYQYYETLAELQERVGAGEIEDGRALRVHGYVVNDSIDRDVAGRQVHFAVQNDPPHGGGAVGTPLQVRYLSLETPDLFKDGAEVVVEGRFERIAGEGTPVFVADNVLAKCPSKFEARAAAES